MERGNACVDPVTGSDGIDVSTANLGPTFPEGAFVTQDDSNDGANQNFKLVPLQHILGTSPAVDDSACSNGGSGGGAGGSSGVGGSTSGGSSGASGYGEPFCTTYCNKCASCYATGAFDEGDCVYQQPKTAFTIEDCQAGCAASATPGAAAKAALPAGFESSSCSAFDSAISSVFSRREPWRPRGGHGRRPAWCGPGVHLPKFAVDRAVHDHRRRRREALRGARFGERARRNPSG